MTTFPNLRRDKEIVKAKTRKVHGRLWPHYLMNLLTARKRCMPVIRGTRTTQRRFAQQLSYGTPGNPTPSLAPALTLTRKYSTGCWPRRGSIPNTQDCLLESRKENGSGCDRRQNEDIPWESSGPLRNSALERYLGQSRSTDDWQSVACLPAC